MPPLRLITAPLYPCLSLGTSAVGLSTVRVRTAAFGLVRGTMTTVYTFWPSMHQTSIRPGTAVGSSASQYVA